MKPLLETILSRKLHDPRAIIYKWLDEYGIKNYTLNDKGEIDVNGDVNLRKKDLKSFLRLFSSVLSKEILIVHSIALHH